MNAPWYVVLSRVPGPRGWALDLTVGRERPSDHDLQLAVEGFEVARCRKAQAVPIVLEWLARGRPSFMQVVSLTGAPT
jgi:hypothetical protein